MRQLSLVNLDYDYEVRSLERVEVKGSVKDVNEKCP